MNKRNLLVLAAVVAMRQACAQQQDINFDNLSLHGAMHAVVPSNYEGLGWTPGAFNYFAFIEAPYTASSPPNRVYTHGPAYISFPNPVTFEGSWFAGHSGATAWWVGYDASGNPIPGDVSSPAMNTTVALDWPGVSEVGLFSNSYDQFIVDDIKYDSGTVPDAGSSGLMLVTAVASLGWLRRRLA